jgi:acetyl esterase
MVQAQRVPASVRAQELVVAVLARAPGWLRKRLAGPDVVVEGQSLAADARMLIRSQRGTESVLVIDGSPTISRATLERNAPVLRARHRPSHGVRTRDLTVAGGAGDLAATLYEPATGAPPSGLLLFFHGGGWVIGSRAGYDHVSHYIVERSGHRVLSVDYRLAPENPFPAAVLDALAVFDDAVARAGEFGADPERVVLGGDSAGATLAAVAARQAAARDHGPHPAGQWLLYPATDLARRHRSRTTFGQGFLLTDADIVWFQDQYLPQGVDRTDPRVSVLYGDIDPRTAPAHLVTAGFDPLRDEGEAYAARLRSAGIGVTAVREADLPHGFLPFLHLGPRFGQAAAASVDALTPMLSRPRSATHGITD